MPFFGLTVTFSPSSTLDTVKIVCSLGSYTLKADLLQELPQDILDRFLRSALLAKYTLLFDKDGNLFEKTKQPTLWVLSLGEETENQHWNILTRPGEFPLAWKTGGFPAGDIQANWRWLTPGEKTQYRVEHLKIQEMEEYFLSRGRFQSTKCVLVGCGKDVVPSEVFCQAHLSDKGK